MLNGLPSVKTAHKRPSRSNSASSSVVTIKKASGTSSRSNSRAPPSRIRPDSPDELERKLTNLTKAASANEQNRRRSTSFNQRARSGDPQELVNGLQHWSQATHSSKGSHENGQIGHRSQSSHSKRASVGAAPPSSYAQRTKSIDEPLPPQGIGRVKQSPHKRIRRDPPPMPENGLILPSVVTLPTPSPFLDAGSASASSTATATPLTSEIMTSSTHITAPTDYFGEKWKKRSPNPSQEFKIEANRGRREGEGSSRTAQQREIMQPISPNSKRRQQPNLSTSGSSKDLIPRSSHSRQREGSPSSSGENGIGGSMSSSHSERERGRSRPPKSSSQKTMLSRALAKANTAVLLDNAHNFAGAIEAYADACVLLGQVMLHSSGSEDRKKLETIRTTYSNRIVELRALDAEQRLAEKTLPTRPESSDGAGNSSDFESEEELPTIETATEKRVITSSYITETRNPPTNYESFSSRAAQTNLALPFGSQRTIETSSYYRDLSPAATAPRSSYHLSVDSQSSVDSRMDPRYMPPPLSPKRAVTEKQEMKDTSRHSLFVGNSTADSSQHSRDISNESTSWLDTIDESGASSTSSLHSRSSSLAYKPVQIRQSIRLDTEFGAELDAAIDAAYDEESDIGEDLMKESSIAERRENVELAKQEVKTLEREAQQLAEERRIQEEKLRRARKGSIGLEYLDDEAEEEERLLEEMTKGYVMEDFKFDLKSKSALPRESNSSGFSGRTYGSSTGSQAATTATSLTTLADAQSTNAKTLPPALPPPLGALPPPPAPTSEPPAPPAPAIALPQPSSMHQAYTGRPPSFGQSPGPSVRDRRLSGTNATQLLVETSRKAPREVKQHPVKIQATPINPELLAAATREKPSSELKAPGDTSEPPTARPLPPVTALQPLTPLTSIHSGDSIPSNSPATPAIPIPTSQPDSTTDISVPRSPGFTVKSKSMPAHPAALRKNMSSSSLKIRNLLGVNTDGLDPSPITPGSAAFPGAIDARKMADSITPIQPTPTAVVFTLGGVPTENDLLDDSIQSPATPQTPHRAVLNAPVPLEPCPESFLLRPFWLMRCLYQTIAHPRGGYLSSKLFVPRDIWRVKNVKLKGTEDKATQCDLLTVALLKLARVDNLDADAVLEEMQHFETVMDQVRQTLSKKLGSEVGLQGSASLFKGVSSHVDEAKEGSDALSLKGNTGGKYLASWRKLRSKSSGSSGISAYTQLPTKDNGHNSLNMPSLPMTSDAAPRRRMPKSNLSNLTFTGPNAQYMGSLARLFDAAQYLGKFSHSHSACASANDGTDQIARQVEDPGLRCSSKTHVGLELAARTAAEFFGFYICRFALNDVGMLLDKFIKRGSEWVLA